MVGNWECGQSKSQQGELHWSLGKWCTNEHHYARVCWKLLSGCWASLRPHRWMSHLCRPGKHPHSPYCLCLHMGSSKWSPGVWWGWDSPCNPGFVQVHSLGPCDPGNPLNRLHWECDKRECNLPFDTPMSDCHVGNDKVTTWVLYSTEYDDVVTTKGSKVIDAFSSKIIHAQMKTAFTSVRLNVMTHTLCAGEGPLPPGLMIQNAYTEMCNGSKDVAVVVRNSMLFPQTQKKKIPVARVVTANWVAEPQVWAGMIDTLDEAQGIQAQKLATEQRQEKLFEKLDLSSLGSWSPELADSTHSLLAEYHNIFSLEPCKLSCSHLTKHMIRFTNDAPFKEWFRWIPHCWWKKSMHTCERCWIQMWFALVRVCGVMLWCWFERRMGVYISAQTFAILMPTWRRTPTHCPESKRHLKVWLAQAVSHAWTWSPDSGRSRWMSCWSSTSCLLLATQASLSLTTCPLGCAMCQPCSRG